ncbi:MAG: hypothetical protein ACK5MP_03405 [Nostocoides sp.]
MTNAVPTRHLARGIAELARSHGGVLSRELLRAHGIDRHRVRNQLAAQRWRAHGRHTIAMHTGELGDVARAWRAIWEVGATRAVLDGVSALQMAGMVGFETSAEVVSVHHVARVPEVEGVAVKKVRHRDHADLAGAGVPRTRPAVAAVHAARWAHSDRQAALLLLLPVQQRLTTGHAVRAAAIDHPGRTRRALIRTLIDDICDGAHSLGELDFARLCRRRGLPPPERQVVCRTAAGRIYLDVRWARQSLVVEIDGAGHRAGLALTDDNLRANAVTLGNERVLRIDLVGLRLYPDAFLDQVAAALR